jgi:hypothetical protein
LGIYPINPGNQRVKWMAIDADYRRSLDDLLKLQYELQQDGIQAALEQSRRSGHLWILFEAPVLAKHARVYIRHLAGKLAVQVKSTGPCDGIELFPKQDRIDTDRLGDDSQVAAGFHHGPQRGLGAALRRYGVMGLMAMSWIFALTPPPIPNMYLVVPHAPLLIIAASVVVVATLASAGQGGTRLPEYQSLSSSTAPAGDRTADNHSKLGMIYFNRADPAFVIEKRFGLGWTLNFGNPWCRVAMAALMGWPLFRMLVR